VGVVVSVGEAKHACGTRSGILQRPRVEAGIDALHAGCWFDPLTRRAGKVSSRTSSGYRAVWDYRNGRYFSVGFSPEYPERDSEQIGLTTLAKMLVADARLQGALPTRALWPYGIVTGGYSVIWRAGGVGSAKGPTVGGMVGCRLKIGGRHAIFAEVGYQKGFQTADGGAYGPSYVITSAGWQVAF